MRERERERERKLKVPEKAKGQSLHNFDQPRVVYYNRIGIERSDPQSEASPRIFKLNLTLNTAE